MKYCAGSITCWLGVRANGQFCSVFRSFNANWESDSHSAVCLGFGTAHFIDPTSFTSSWCYPLNPGRLTQTHPSSAKLKKKKVSSRSTSQNISKAPLEGWSRVFLTYGGPRANIECIWLGCSRLPLLCTHPDLFRTHCSHSRQSSWLCGEGEQLELLIWVKGAPREGSDGRVSAVAR